MRRIFFLLAIVVALSALAAPFQAAADVLGVRAAAKPDGARLVIDLSGDSAYRAFALASPPRVVVDLPKTGWRASSTPGRGGGLKAVRHGLFRADVYRLVFDLERPGAIQAASMIGGKNGAGRRLVVDVSFAQKPSSQRFGSFQPKKPGQAPAAPPRRQREWVVVIDPGHGGVDPGAIGLGGVVEKRVNLSVAKMLQRILGAKPGYRVELTRSTDVFLRLRERVKIGRAKEADLFVSIHADSHPDRDVSGASLYTLSETASDKEAARLARSENAADLVGGAPLEEDSKEVASILIDLAQRETKNQSSAAADDILFALAPTQPLLRRPKRSAGFAVLKAPDVPSVLIELGFLSNKADAKRLARKADQEAIARAIAAGIVRYFEGANTARALEGR